MFLKWFDQDWGYDYDEGGKHKDGAENTDPQAGGIVQVAVAPDGKAEAVPVGDADNSGDTYAIVFADLACSKPLKRSGTQP